MIDGDQIRVDIADLAILGFHPGEDEPIEKDREALPARDGSHRVGSLPCLCENLGVIRMARAIDVPHVVCPNG
jgi:hypothetical protein